MFKRKVAEKYIETHYIQLPDLKLPLEVHYEHRRSARVSLAKSKGILRMPILVSVQQKEQHLDWAHQWITKKLNEDPVYRQRYIPKNYATGQLIQLREREFILDVREIHDKKSASGFLKQNVLNLRLPSNYDIFQKQKACSTLISRILSKVFLPEFSQRVDELNDLHFQKEINEIRFKYNHSNWGSCSSNGNLNFSSRLLLTPQFITDYIIIHELAHLVHMNHSKRFWDRVQKAMPDYMLAEKWLKKYGEKCNW
jgi:predicted metal-dependent hydrolase